jgi:2-(1,2-epoxy-1,2-dihydrophenyl)acetyl-CoA isomerase
MMMLGEKITAARALEYGMIYQVCDPNVLGDAALTVAKTLAALPTKAIWLTKQGLNASLGRDLEAQLSLEEELQRIAGKTKDFGEGVTAFLEKRKPVFTGK